MASFRINPEYRPLADQPQAIAKLSDGIKKGFQLQTLLGATGTGKTFTAAGVIEAVQRPALFIAPNKTLAAQLVGEFRELFPQNRVEYFVSYYDHYQPEAYVPRKDLFIEKDASVNEEIDRLRHAATSALLQRQDVIVVASVSCIYGIGSPQRYQEQTLFLRKGQEMPRETFAPQLSQMQYSRNDTVLERGNFSWRGEIVEIWPPGGKEAYRLKLWGDEIEEIEIFDPLSKKITEHPEEVTIWPASHWVADEKSMEAAANRIEQELRARLPKLDGLARERLRTRTEYDLEMIREMGWVSGIENYSAVIDGRAPGEPPHTLLDFFPEDFLLFLDESHQSVPQIGAMYEGDRARKQTLVDYGFRLPSALDNRPLRWEEFQERIHQTICLSATPGKWEQENSEQVVEQIVRPTGILDPQISVRPTDGQVDDLLGEIRSRAKKGERTLVTTLTKKMAEDLSQYLLQQNIKTCYLHSDVQTLERVRIIRDLRLGKYDALVGVNLLREGLDLPEVSLVAILDADKEGFLRGETSLVQTIGRAARNPHGRVIFYADKKSKAMKRAIEETRRRRKIQSAYNKKHGQKAQALKKTTERDLLGISTEHKTVTGEGDLRQLLVELETDMAKAAEELRFEEAARLRDEIEELRDSTR